MGLLFGILREYFKENNSWQSRVASFKFSAGFENDLSVVDIVNPENGILSNSETVKIAIRNLGTESQTNFPVKLYLDGVLMATETYTGTINVGDEANYIFSQTLDLSIQGQTYSIGAEVILPTDQYSINDAKNEDVRHLYSNDLGD